jgi:hypothetical protein
MNEKMTTSAHSPCWDRDTREKTITKIASLGDESRDRFLATHSPITNLEKIGVLEKIGEELAFQEIIDFSNKEATIVVKGAPGTGKSHFINWLKLRCDYESHDHKLKNTTVVLIQRRSGSLKDTLEQLIEQLPKDLQIYLEPVRRAVTALSNEELKTRLAQSIYNHFVHRAGDNFLPRIIKSLPQAFIAEGFGRWLTREGGAIDRNVKLLTSNSEVNERSVTPEFTKQDFLIEDVQLKLRGLNSKNVLDLIDEIEEDEDEIIPLLVEKSNAVLRNSVQELLGLNNTALTDIFNNIRRDLRQSNQKLILLIEDVSTLSVLDHEIVNAVEPNNDNSLCPITSVLGMTEPAFTALRDNQKQRLSLVLSLPKDPASSGWASDANVTDQFVARYLNAIRMRDDQVSGLVRNMQLKQKLSDSACTDCIHKDECFSNFGTVDVDEVAIGLYPFRNKSANELLNRIKEKNNYGKTQRGLIEVIINPTLSYFEKVSDGKRQRLDLDVSVSYPSYFPELRERFLKGWDTGEVELFNYLTNVWSQGGGLDQVIAEIQPLLPYFKLPKYSDNVSEHDRPQSTSKVPPKPRTISQQQSIMQAQQDDAGFEKENDKLMKWSIEHKDFPAPQKMQSLIVDFIAASLSTYNHVDTRPSQAFSKTFNFRSDIVKMEGMSARSAVMLNPYEFKRTKETSDFFVALLRFEFYGKKSWDFENGEKYKRVAYSWFRRNRDKIVNIFAAKDQESASLDEFVPIQQAVRLLFLLKSAANGKKLPSDPVKRLEELFRPVGNFMPSALSKKMRELHEDLEARAAVLKKFVLEELNQSQGGASSIKIIDPTSIFEILEHDDELFSITELHEGYFKGPPKNRYSGLDKLKHWAKLSDALDDELVEVAKLVENIDGILSKWGFTHTSDYSNLSQFYQELTGVFEAIRDILKTPIRDLSVWFVDKALFPVVETSAMLAKINKLIETDNSKEFLYFNLNNLITFREFILKIDEVLTVAEAGLDDRIKNSINADEPAQYLDAIIEDLSYVAEKVIV